MINYNFKTANIWIFGYSRIVLIALLSMASFVGVLILLNTMYSFVLAHEDYADIKIMDPKLRFDVVATDFKFPTGIAFLGNNDLLLIEKNTGNVIRVQNGTETKPLLTLSIANQSERGLLGLAVTEMGSIPRYVFLYYTEADKTNPNNVLGNRVYRYELVDNETS